MQISIFRQDNGAVVVRYGEGMLDWFVAESSDTLDDIFATIESLK